jgi:hypothetical protein
MERLVGTAGSGLAAVAFALHNPGAMLRRALLLACLLAPLAGRAQTINTIPASPFSKDECNGTIATNVTVNWSMASGVQMPAGGTYRLVVSTTAGCDTSSSATAVATGLAPITTSDPTGLTGQRFPLASADPSTLTFKDIAAKAGVTGATCASNPTIYLCAQLMKSDNTWWASTGYIALKVESGPPPTPTLTSVSPGDAALMVAWTAGTDNGVATSHYRVTAKVVTCATPPNPMTPECLATSPASEGSTSSTSLRLSGLAIGTLYGVQVYAVSATNSSSPASNILTGTPINTYDYWEVYQAMNGAEQGGCAAGPAGALSLLAVAGLLRARRRRP